MASDGARASAPPAPAAGSIPASPLQSSARNLLEILADGFAEIYGEHNADNTPATSCGDAIRLYKYLVARGWSITRHEANR